jgi:hypothetical protein
MKDNKEWGRPLGGWWWLVAARECVTFIMHHGTVIVVLRLPDHELYDVA